MERLSGGRVASANNAFSAVRCAFRLLFGRCLQPGELTQLLVLADLLLQAVYTSDACQKLAFSQVDSCVA
jgi:hypothetical protein